MRVTASKTGLLAYCQYWARHDAVWTDSTSAAADRGTRFHRWIETYTRTIAGLSRWTIPTPDPDLADLCDQARQWIERTSAEHIVVGVEQAYAWEPSTGRARVLETSSRDYAQAQSHGLLCGTADLVLRDAEGTLCVYDWKTGDASKSGPQLRTLAVLAASALGETRVRVAALQVSAAGVEEIGAETLDEWDLTVVSGEISGHVERIQDAEPTPGSHCGELYCPARLKCPAGTAVIPELVPADSLARKWRITDPIETADQAAWALDTLRLVSAQIDAIKDEIKRVVPPEGWLLSDGRTLREVKATSPLFSKEKAIALCTQLGATQEQIASLTTTYERSNGLRVSSADKPRRKKAS